MIKESKVVTKDTLYDESKKQKSSEDNDSGNGINFLLQHVSSIDTTDTENITPTSRDVGQEPESESSHTRSYLLDHHTIVKPNRENRTAEYNGETLNTNFGGSDLNLKSNNFINKNTHFVGCHSKVTSNCETRTVDCKKERPNNHNTNDVMNEIRDQNRTPLFNQSKFIKGKACLTNGGIKTIRDNELDKRGDSIKASKEFQLISFFVRNKQKLLLIKDKNEPHMTCEKNENKESKRKNFLKNEPTPSFHSKREKRGDKQFYQQSEGKTVRNQDEESINRRTEEEKRRDNQVQLQHSVCAVSDQITAKKTVRNQQEFNDNNNTGPDELCLHLCDNDDDERKLLTEEGRVWQESSKISSITANTEEFRDKHNILNIKACGCLALYQTPSSDIRDNERDFVSSVPREKLLILIEELKESVEANLRRERYIIEDTISRDLVVNDSSLFHHNYSLSCEKELISIINNRKGNTMKSTIMSCSSENNCNCNDGEDISFIANSTVEGVNVNKKTIVVESETSHDEIMSPTRLNFNAKSEDCSLVVEKEDDECSESSECRSSSSSSLTSSTDSDVMNQDVVNNKTAIVKSTSLTGLDSFTEKNQPRNKANNLSSDMRCMSLHEDSINDPKLLEALSKIDGPPSKDQQQSRDNKKPTSASMEELDEHRHTNKHRVSALNRLNKDFANAMLRKAVSLVEIQNERLKENVAKLEQRFLSTEVLSATEGDEDWVPRVSMEDCSKCVSCRSRSSSYHSLLYDFDTANKFPIYQPTVIDFTEEEQASFKNSANNINTHGCEDKNENIDSQANPLTETEPIEAMTDDNKTRMLIKAKKERFMKQGQAAFGNFRDRLRKVKVKV